MWKAPKRPANEITQTYNDGIVNIFTVTDEAEPGYQPKEKLTPFVSLRYENRRLGIERYYSGRQNQTEIQRVIRVPHIRQNLSNRNKAITEDGTEYRIDLVQMVPDVYPPSDDLTLARYTQGVSS